MGYVNCTYDNIERVRRFRLTMGHDGGIVATLEVCPQFNIPAQDGVLFLTDGIRYISIPGCRLDRTNIVYSTSGHVVQVQVLGPTWKWHLAGIDGSYNVLRPDGSFYPGTERSPQELATLLFQSMNVPQFDVSLLPNATRPFRKWKGMLALTELKNLCYELGCSFGHDIFTGSAYIWKLGEGSFLPSGEEQTIDYGLNLAEPPDSIRAYCSPTGYQLKFKTEAVLPSKQGEWMAADDVDYAPDDGWLGHDPFDPLPGNQDKEAKALARRFLWRAWRITSLADGGFNIPTYGPVGGMADLLPLKDRLLDDYENDGVFEKNGFLEGTIALDSDPAPYRNSRPFTIIDVPHRLDGKRGIVFADFPLFKLDSLDQFQAADVYYTGSCRVRDSRTFAPAYYSREVFLNSNGTGFLPIHRPDLQRRVIAQYNQANVTGTKDNTADLDNQLLNQIQAVAVSFQPVAAVVKRYRGLIPIRLDGMTRQISYHGSCYGPQSGFFTTAAQNTEWEIGLPRFQQRRRRNESDRLRMMRDIYDYERHQAYEEGY